MKAERFAEMRFLRCTCAAHAGPRSPKTERGGFLKANKTDAGGRAQPAPHQVGERVRGRTVGDSPRRSAARGQTLGNSPRRSAARGQTLGDSPRRSAVRGQTLGDSPRRSAARGQALGNSPRRSAVRGQTLGDSPRQSAARGQALGDSPRRSAARGRTLGDSPRRNTARGRSLSTPEAAGRLRDAGRCGRRTSAGRCAGRGNPAAGNPGRTRFCRPAALFFIPIFAFTRINNFKSKVYSTLSDAPCPRRHAGRILFEVCCGCTKARSRKHAGRRGEGHGDAERAARVLSAGSPAGRAARGRLRWPDR